MYELAQIDNGQTWGVGSFILHGDGLHTEAQIIVPVEALNAMTDMEIGHAVRSLITRALRCTALDKADDILRLPNPFQRMSRAERQATRAELLPFASVASEVAQAIAILEGRIPHPHQRPRPKPDNTSRHAGYVYLLRSAHGYKIGKTKDLPHRITVLSLQLPFPVELLHTIPTHNRTRAERELHARFADRRINGEWFALSDDDVAWITSLTEL